jgi:hypothetical protein
MSDSKRSLAESILALPVGSERAAAIYGDLLELAATRMRASFWTSYFTTLLSLCWRPLTALCFGGLIFAVLYDRLIFPMWLFAMCHTYAGTSIADATMQLWFLVPFGAVRYGIRDRIVQLAFATLLIATGIIFLDLWLGNHTLAVCVTFASVAAICMVISRPWRISMISLVVSCAVGVATLECLEHIGWLATPAIATVDMLFVSIVFSRVHHWLHRPQLTGGVHA